MENFRVPLETEVKDVPNETHRVSESDSQLCCDVRDLPYTDTYHFRDHYVADIYI